MPLTLPIFHISQKTHSKIKMTLPSMMYFVNVSQSSELESSRTSLWKIGLSVTEFRVQTKTRDVLPVPLSSA